MKYRQILHTIVVVLWKVQRLSGGAVLLHHAKRCLRFLFFDIENVTCTVHIAQRYFF